MRYHIPVIKNVLGYIPVIEETAEFRDKVEKLIENHQYKAPEQMEPWYEMSVLLEANIPFPPVHYWQCIIAALWMDKTLLDFVKYVKEAHPDFALPEEV